MSKKIRRGDFVKAIAGNSKGLAGEVLFRKGDKVVVKGLNLRKKHIKPNERYSKGTTMKYERPIHISNLRVCLENEIPIKLKMRTNKDGERELYYISSGQQVLYRPIKKPK